MIALEGDLRSGSLMDSFNSTSECLSNAIVIFLFHVMHANRYLAWEIECDLFFLLKKHSVPSNTQ